ncbi:MAG: hypothetical protein R3247_14185 [Rhodothermales bacterium]|nr:hypothetical protein [Rhodothermales bacterium]
MRTGLVALLIVVLALAWFNPGMDAFSLFIGEQSERLVLRETGDTALGRALAGLGGGLAGAYVDRLTERANYGVFSTYTLDFDAGREGDEWRFVGIAGQFIETERPDFLEQQPETP